MAQSIIKRTNRILEKYRDGDFNAAIQSFREIPSALLEQAIVLLGDPIVFKFNSFERERIAYKAARKEVEKLERSVQMKAEQVANTERVQRFEQLKKAVSEYRDNDCDAAKIAASSEYLQTELNTFLTKPERMHCQILRSTALWGARVKERLGCTQTELDRWDKDGRLPHAFLGTWCASGKTVLGRKWFAEDVGMSDVFVPEWREQDQKRKVARRTKLKLVA